MSDDKGLREALEGLTAKWRKRVEPLRNLGESNKIVAGWVEECAYELEAALAAAPKGPINCELFGYCPMCGISWLFKADH